MVKGLQQEKVAGRDPLFMRHMAGMLGVVWYAKEGEVEGIRTKRLNGVCSAATRQAGVGAGPGTTTFKYMACNAARWGRWGTGVMMRQQPCGNFLVACVNVQPVCWEGSAMGYR